MDGISQFQEMNHTCDSLIRNIDKLADRLKSGELHSSEGISLLDTKNDTFLSYLMNLTYVIAKKVAGLPIEMDKAIERLVESRIVLERIKPVEQKLKYQIDKYVRAAITGTSDPNDKTKFRANPTDLADESEGSESEDESESTKKVEKNEKVGIYLPPKLAAVPYEDDSVAAKRQKLLERAKKRALNTSIMQELKEEYLDAPVELSHTSTLRNTRTKYEKERESYEETYFTRLPITKKDKHREKLMSSLTMGKLGSEITHFEDISALEGTLPSSSKKRRRPKSKGQSIKKKGYKKRKTI